MTIYNNLMHLCNKEALTKCYEELSEKKAVVTNCIKNKLRLKINNARSYNKGKI
ncbi:Uncharacterised protein [Orientia tsutsugamushi]|uniref:Uncharacterized protein n=4 Tax=Orientia tsutsugamushi TaxID=784 RepID=A5CF37_ORITB|nr:hypothetical protein [Orientia tsutsugamushi]KJV70509.1 hypothetical protein OTSUT76_3962 [Orientia tsutsugamushi str. UT76]KJV74613.1 hypothetical protein OTSTA763_0995 [Orientia tsutsugamushi str. TA763]KJV76264.1 hypothetical protein OTSTA716_0860 [Orientia tsutsugamushi str. TA716]CAM80900.1 hypothetical protein OTBS_1805 [Orientia tsutsugamushi str. Boryong]KJV97156.1 hypothetical protein OTSUT76_0235 [Orientia tsutsugamushi str. UT76]